MTSHAPSGFKVVDLGWHVAGSYCTKLLASLGAEVIKIEQPGKGDPARKMGPFPSNIPHPEKSALFLYLNTGKKGVTLDLKTKIGIEIFNSLIEDADVLVENFSPRVMPSLGLDYERLAKLNPGLVMTSISNFGQTGPYRDNKTTELVSQAIGGFMYLSGAPDREPLKLWGRQAEYQAGLNAFVATQTALFGRLRGHGGQCVDVSIMECLAAVLEYAPVAYTYSGLIWKRWFGRHMVSYPHGDILPCRDGYVAVPPVREWEEFTTWLDVPELKDPRFATLGGRVENWEELESLLNRRLMEGDKRDLTEDAQAWRFAFTYVATLEDLMNDPQHRARGYLVEIEHPEAGRLTYPGEMVRMSETPMTVSDRAPLLGEHNEEIYCGRLGYSKGDLVRLRQMAAI